MVDVDIGVPENNTFTYPSIFQGLPLDLEFVYQADFFRKTYIIPTLASLPAPTISNAFLTFNFTVTNQLSAGVTADHRTSHGPNPTFKRV